jgi:hypothetical protein
MVLRFLHSSPGWLLAKPDGLVRLVSLAADLLVAQALRLQVYGAWGCC